MSEELTNASVLISSRQRLETLLLAVYDKGEDREYDAVYNTITPRVDDPNLRFVADTVLLADELFQELQISDRQLLNALPPDEKDARIAGYMARELLVVVDRQYPDLIFELLRIKREGVGSDVGSINIYAKEYATRISEAMLRATDAFDKMKTSGSYIY